MNLKYCEAVSSQVVDLLRKERERQGLSMNALAAKAGLAHSAISRIERRLRSPNLETLVRIAVVLRVDLGRLVNQAFRGADKAVSAPAKE